MAKCCMCDVNIDREDAPVLSMGGAGYARVLCDRCASLLDTATLGRDFDEIKDAIEQIGTIMADHDPDGVTFAIVSNLMIDAADRAKAIETAAMISLLTSRKKTRDMMRFPRSFVRARRILPRTRRTKESLSSLTSFIITF